VERGIENEIKFLKKKHHPAPSVRSPRKSYTPDAKIEASDKIVIGRVVVEGEKLAFIMSMMCRGGSLTSKLSNCLGRYTP
jgi:hypothetical protein